MAAIEHVGCKLEVWLGGDFVLLTKRGSLARVSYLRLRDCVRKRSSLDVVLNIDRSSLLTWDV